VPGRPRLQRVGAGCQKACQQLGCSLTKHPRAHFGKGVYKNQATKMLSKHAVPVDKYKNLKVLSFQLDASQRSRVRWNMTET